MGVVVSTSGMAEEGRGRKHRRVDKKISFLLSRLSLDRGAAVLRPQWIFSGKLTMGKCLVA